MKIIEILSGKIKSELHDATDDLTKAENYISQPMYKDLALIYKKIGLQELEHVMIWHDAAVKEINKYKDKGNVVPPQMQAKYDVLHEIMIEEYSRIKSDLEKIN